MVVVGIAIQRCHMLKLSYSFKCVQVCVFQRLHVMDGVSKSWLMGGGFLIVLFNDAIIL